MTLEATLGGIADDLSGALDIACAFATVQQPVRVSWQANVSPDEQPVVYTTDSRDLTEEEAISRVGRTVAVLEGSRLAFKKIDSVMRGHPVAETHAWFQRGFYDLLAVIPAFPRYGRVTRDGQQWLYASEGASWQPVGSALPLAFSRLGYKVSCAKAARLEATDAEVVVVDAETDADIEEAIGRISSWSKRVLWCGTGGLAGALGRYSAPPPLVPPSLILVGTTHPVTLAQLRTLALPTQPLVGQPLRQEPGGKLTVICADDQPRSALAVRQTTRSALVSLRTWQPPAVIFVSGGQTLQLLCEALEGDALDCLGSLRPGLPVARLLGGYWHGVHIISKSGGFGHPELLLELLQKA